MEQANKHIAHLPTAYQCAIETLGSNGERTQERLNGLCEHFASSYGLQTSEHHQQWTFDAWCLAKRRYWL